MSDVFPADPAKAASLIDMFADRRFTDEQHRAIFKRVRAEYEEHWEKVKACRRLANCER